MYVTVGMKISICIYIVAVVILLACFVVNLRCQYVCIVLRKFELHVNLVLVFSIAFSS